MKRLLAWWARILKIGTCQHATFIAGECLDCGALVEDLVL